MKSLAPVTNRRRRFKQMVSLLCPKPSGVAGECLRAGLLCNDSVLVRDDGKIRVQGDPTEAALIVAAEKAGISMPRSFATRPARCDSVRIRACSSWQLCIGERMATSFIRKARLNVWSAAVQRCCDNAWRRSYRLITNAIHRRGRSNGVEGSSGRWRSLNAKPQRISARSTIIMSRKT